MEINRNSPIAFTSPSNGVARPAVQAQSSTAAPAAQDGVTISSGNASSAAAPTVNASPTPAAPAAPTPKEWTIMTYFCSDNNLYPYEVNNLSDMEKVGGSANMNVVAEMSHESKGGHVVRYDVQKENPGTHSPVTQDLGSINMSDPKSLADFIKWTKTNYPAKHYMLVMNDHGNGWEGCCASDKHNGWFTLPQLEDGLKAGADATDGKPLDIVGFDCCLMANVENLDQIGKQAKFLVGSEETEGGPGWSYNQVLTGDLLKSLQTTQRDGKELSAQDLATRIVKSAHGHDHDLPTMSAVDTSKIPDLMASIKNFGQAIQDTKTVSNTDIAAAADSAQKFYLERDLSDFAGKVAAKSGDNDKNLTAAAQAVQSAISNTLVAEEHSAKYPGAHGLTIELTRQDPTHAPLSINPDPSLSRVTFGKYKDLRFAQDVGFNHAVDKFRTGAAVEAQQV